MTKWNVQWSTVAASLLLMNASIAWGFDSTSTGADGALVLTTPGVIDFDPTTFVPPLDPEGDNIYHFTTITIGAGVTVRLSGANLNGPVFWLASGAVQIDGVIDLDGADGQQAGFSLNLPAIPGAGGFPGGVGGSVVSEPQNGGGPGGGLYQANNHGGGAGHATNGNGNFPGMAYGSDFLVPLIGGSGGGGGVFLSGNGGGGGAGGGALLIASSVSATIDGTIRADGGDGGSPSVFGGGGSGGAIRIAAPVIAGSGTVQAQGGGSGGGSGGSVGRIRLEAIQQDFTGTSNPTALWRAPHAAHLPANPPPSVRVTSVGGIALPNPSTGSFTVPDVTIGTAGPVTVELEGNHIPLGTTVELTLFSDDGATQVVTSTALAGTETLSTASASVTIPSGFTRGFARATWTP